MTHTKTIKLAQDRITEVILTIEDPDSKKVALVIAYGFATVVSAVGLIGEMVVEIR